MDVDDEDLEAKLSARNIQHIRFLLTIYLNTSVEMSIGQTQSIRHYSYLIERPLEKTHFKQAFFCFHKKMNSYFTGLFLVFYWCFSTTETIRVVCYFDSLASQREGKNNPLSKNASFVCKQFILYFFKQRCWSIHDGKH